MGRRRGTGRLARSPRVLASRGLVQWQDAQKGSGVCRLTESEESGTFRSCHDDHALPACQRPRDEGKTTGKAGDRGASRSMNAFRPGRATRATNGSPSLEETGSKCCTTHANINRVGRVVFWAVSSLFLLALIVWCGVLGMRTIDESRSRTCRYNLQLIGRALLNYQQLHGTFPPAYLCDKAGKPVNSWRAAVVPYFSYNFRPGRDDYAGGPGYDDAEPWNGPKNSMLRYGPQNAKVPLNKHRCEELQCPSDRKDEPAITHYVAVIGPNTMWPGGKAAKPAADGSDRDKILVIEVVHSDILWMEPRDLTLDQALDNIQPKTGIGIGSHHRHGIHYVTVAGEVRTLDPNIDRESLRRLLVRDSAGSPSR